MSRQDGRVDIVEVAPRDGLQSEDVILDAATKIELIERSVAAGVRRIEVCSFVNPARVPQMADAEAVLAGLPDRDDVTYIGLVLNRRGFGSAPRRPGCGRSTWSRSPPTRSRCATRARPAMRPSQCSKRSRRWPTMQVCGRP